MSRNPSPSKGGTNRGGASEPTSIDPRIELTLDEKVGHYVDMWKKSVDVQQHFNDIEWRIRGLALTVATFALGAAGVAAKDGTKVGWLSLGFLVVSVGLILWYAFYFVDRYWYHPLLKAAVKQGTIIENEIKRTLPKAGMTSAITAGSPRTVGRIVGFLSRKPSMHSEDKLVWFYKVGAVAFVVAGVALQCGAVLANAKPQPTKPLDVRIVQSPAPSGSPPASTAQTTAPNTPSGAPAPSTTPRTPAPAP